jgi:hypothetical protein
MSDLSVVKMLREVYRLDNATVSITSNVEKGPNAFRSLQRFMGLEGDDWDDGESCKSDDVICIVYYAPIKHDRSCLLPPPAPPQREATEFQADSATEIVNFISRKARLHRDIHGNMDPFGEYIHTLHNNLFTIPDQSSTIPRSYVQCETIDYHDMMVTNTSTNTFIQDYWLRQRPVIINNFPSAMQDRDASIQTLLRRYGSEQVGVKLSPSAEFEGIDNASNWGDFDTQGVPPVVLEQLVRPDLTVVRAAHMQMAIDDVLEVLRETSSEGYRHQHVHHDTRQDTKTSVEMYPHMNSYDALNAYVEYLPLKGRLERLHDEVTSAHKMPTWWNDAFLDAKAHMWIGDGNTIGMYVYVCICMYVY